MTQKPETSVIFSCCLRFWAGVTERKPILTHVGTVSLIFFSLFLLLQSYIRGCLKGPCPLLDY